MKKRWPGLVLGVSVSLVALVYLFRRDLGGVRDELLHARYWAVIPCLVLSGVGLWLRAIRWRVLLNGRLPLDHSFHILNISYFINAVLPLRVGELARAALARRLDPPVRVFTSLSTILVERLLDTLTVFGLVGLTLTLIPTQLEVGLLGGLLGVGALVGVIVLAVFAAHPAWGYALFDQFARFLPLLRRPRLRGWVGHFLDGIAPLASVGGLLQAVWWTAAAWTASVIAGYVLLYAVFDDPTWAAAMAMVALASFAIAVPAVPGNLGPFEAATVFALAGAGLVDDPGAAPAVAFALLLHAVNLLTYIACGLVGLWTEDVQIGDLAQAVQNLRAQQKTPAGELETAAEAGQ
ncbi:MAG: flippase-like domain-containing protein [Anaerolineae bacterium]|nr:flippase-like domain-containing protein [Anaerolineae bacterium]